MKSQLLFWHLMLGFHPSLRAVEVKVSALSDPSPRRTPGPSVFAFEVLQKKSLGPGERRGDDAYGPNHFQINALHPPAATHVHCAHTGCASPPEVIRGLINRAGQQP
jgi:hypothetical protein